MSSSSEEGWKQQRSQRLPAAAGPAWLCAALAEAAAAAAVRKAASPPSGRERSELVLLCTEQGWRGRPAELSLGALSTAGVPPGTGHLRWVRAQPPGTSCLREQRQPGQGPGHPGDGGTLSGLLSHPCLFGYRGLGPGLPCEVTQQVQPATHLQSSSRWRPSTFCHCSILTWSPPHTYLDPKPQRAWLWGQRGCRVPWAWQGWRLNLSSQSRWGPSPSAWRSAVWSPPRHT